MNSKKKTIPGRPQTCEETKSDRYDEFDLENLVLSDSIKEGALKGSSLDQLHVMLRAMSILGFRIQDSAEQNAKRFDELDSKIGKVSKEIRSVKRIQDGHTIELKSHSDQLIDLDERLSAVEKKIA